jgi:hypothetical protein
LWHHCSICLDCGVAETDCSLATDSVEVLVYVAEISGMAGSIGPRHGLIEGVAERDVFLEMGGH